MKRYINQLLAGMVLVGAPVLTSCSSDYLETDPTESVSADVATATAESGYMALNGIAKTMSTQQYAWSQGCAGENRIFVIYENYGSQDYFYNYYATGWAPIMNLQYSTRNNTSYDAYPWYYYYTLVGQANTIIAHIDEATGEPGLVKFDKASALTYRAYAFEKLLHYYAPRWQDSNNGAADGIILRLDESTGGMGLSSMADCYKQIYEDCEEAIKLFKESGMDRSSNEVWIANENVAHAVYARAALTRQDYAKALEQAKLAREGYPLMDNTAYYSGFCRPTSEWIFGSYGDASENNWYWSYGTQYACNGYYAANTANGAGSINIDLTNQIPDNDIRKGLFLTPDKFPSYNLSDPTVPDAYYLTYGMLGISNDPLWEEVDAYVEKRHAIGASAMARPYAPGYYYIGGHLKFYVFDTPGVSYLPFIRSSEMYLIEAEANYFLNNTTAAQEALVALNTTTDRTPGYTCDKTGNDLFQEIVNYRELELWGEGVGFSDYKRWNMPISRRGLAQGGSAHSAIAKNIAANDPNWTWVIPQWETDYNDAFKSTADESAE
jgi:hypothetical protein